jgi:hypothetical protein
MIRIGQDRTHYKGEMKQRRVVTNASNAHLLLHGKGGTSTFIAKWRRDPSTACLPLLA